MPNDTLLTPTQRPRTGAPLREAASSFSELHGLTARERDVVYLLASGVAQVAELARALLLRPNTVHNHLKGIFRRTRTRSKSELLAALLLHAIERTDLSAQLYRRPQVLLLGASRGFASTLGALGMRVHEGANERDLVVPDDVRVDVVVATWTDEAQRQALRTRIDRQLGASARLLSIAVEGEPTATGDRSSGLPLPADPHRLAFEILVVLCDDPYTLSRLVRIDSQLPVVVDHATHTQLVNLSFGGAFVAMSQEALKAPDAPHAGEVVELALWLTDEQPVRTRATVVWTRACQRVALPAGIGVRFDDVPSPDRTRLEDFVRWKRIEALRSSVTAVRRPAAALA